MDLARPRIFGILLGERWNVLTQQIQPRIDLAIEPVLATLAAGSGRDATGGAPTPGIFRHERSTMRLSESPGRASTSSAERFDARSFLRTGGFGASGFGKVRLQSFSAGSTTPDSSFKPGLQAPKASGEAYPALLAALCRLQNAQTQRALPADEVFEQVKILVERIVRQTQRIEKEGDGVQVVVRPQVSGAPSAITQVAQPAIGLIESARPTRERASAGGPPALTNSPSVNIETLTDQVVQQIDRRMTAWRERMGRI